MSINDKPHLLVLTSTFPRWAGDVEPTFVFDLCRYLAASGMLVTVLAPHAKGASEREVIEAVEVRRFRYAPAAWEKLAYQGGIVANLKRTPWLYGLLPIFLLAQFWATLRSLRAFRFDAVHAHWIVPQGLVLAVALLFSATKPRWICTVHGSDVFVLRGAFWSWLRRWITSRTDHLVAVSEDLRRALVAQTGAGAISVIPMGADLQEVFVPDGRQRATAELLFVGRLVEGKGLLTLIRALPNIRAMCPAVRLTIIGDGPERERLGEAVLSSDVAASVLFVGALEHSALAEHFRRATLLVLPSLQEGFGLVVVEALGCACPVVASDLPALRDLLQDGRAGRLFRAGDPEDLKEQVCELLADERLRDALAAAGRAAVLERYDWRTLAQRYRSVLLP